MAQSSLFPTVSIIIPVFNDLKSLKKVIPEIINQDYPIDKIEVIVIDNGSDEDVAAYLSSLVGVSIRFLKETDYPGSPYSCRNRGIEISRGEIIILLDATCIPLTGWLKNGVNELIGKDADIVGGDVMFNVSSNPSIVEIYDATMNVRMEWAIKERNCAYTANLFIKKKVFDKIGLFPEGIRSGGDVRWTKKATKQGAKLLFVKSASILKSTRNKKQIINKKWRTSKFQTVKWKDIGAKYFFLRHIKAFIQLVIIPPSPYRVKFEKRLEPKIYGAIPLLRLRIWVLDYRLRILEGFGIISGGINYWLSR